MSRRQLSRRERSVLAAMERVYWSVFKFTDDVDDIQDGPFPLGESIRRCKGYSEALEFAKLVMVNDPLVRFVKLVPEITGGGVQSFEVRRPSDNRSARERLDPHRGDEEFRVQRRQKIEETKRSRPGAN